MSEQGYQLLEIRQDNTKKICVWWQTDDDMYEKHVCSEVPTPKHKSDTMDKDSNGSNDKSRGDK